MELCPLTEPQVCPLLMRPLITLIQDPAGSGDDPGGLVGQGSARCPWGLWGQGFQPRGDVHFSTSAVTKPQPSRIDALAPQSSLLCKAPTPAKAHWICTGEQPEMDFPPK